MVGLEFWVRFRRSIYADATIRLEWLVVRVTPNAQLRGEIVELPGRLTDHNGVTALVAKGKVLVTAHLERPAAQAPDAIPPIAPAPAMTSS